MAAILYTILFLLGGLFIIRQQIPTKSPLTRAFLGLALGLLLEMQLPALCAYALGFTLRAHYVAACLLLALAGVLIVFLCLPMQFLLIALGLALTALGLLLLRC